MKPGFSLMPLILQIGKLRLGQSRDQQTRAILSPLASLTPWATTALREHPNVPGKRHQERGTQAFLTIVQTEFSEVTQRGSCSADLFWA